MRMFALTTISSFAILSLTALCAACAVACGGAFSAGAFRIDLVQDAAQYLVAAAPHFTA